MDKSLPPSSSGTQQKTAGTAAAAPTRRSREVRDKWEKLGFSKLLSPNGKVVLVGDSVLDDFYWLQDSRRSLRVVVEEMLRAEGGCATELDEDTEAEEHGAPWCEGWDCLNFAVDQMSSFDFLTREPRTNSWLMYQGARTRAHKNDAEADALDKDGYKHLCGADGVIRTADNLGALGPSVRHVFLSIGGNDIYLNAGVQTDLGGSLVPFCDKREAVADALAARVNKLLDEVEAQVPGARITPVICYHPHHAFSISGLRKGCLASVAKCVQQRYLGWMVTPIIRSLLRICRQRGYHAIDLSQTFDPTNERHYGTMDVTDGAWSGAEPSDVSHCFTARLMMDVMRACDGGSVAPRLFHGVVTGDNYQSTRQCVLTEESASAYQFHLGVPAKHFVDGAATKVGEGSGVAPGAAKCKKGKTKKIKKCCTE